jgi:hypothetical protein
VNYKEYKGNIFKEDTLLSNEYIIDKLYELDYCNEEIERLNNIINELEKTLLEWHEFWEDNDEYHWQYKNAYDYLQELKGSDKE